MARIDLPTGVTPSLLDRLIDPGSAGTVDRGGYTIEQLVGSVRRDMEDLLNTRVSTYGISDDFVEVKRSIVEFGLPDFTYFDISTGAARMEIGRLVEQTVGKFEPRLKDVRASIADDPSKPQRLNLRIQIDARLCVEPFPDVAFETVIEMSTGHASVQARKA